MIPLQSLQNPKDNFGGIRRAELIFESDIVNFPAYLPTSATYTGQMTLRSGATPYGLYFTNTQSQANQNANITSDAGDFYAQSVTLRTPKFRPLTRLLTDRLRNNRVTLVVQDFNEVWTIYRQMRIAPAMSSGTKAKYNGTTLACSGQSIRPAGIWEYTPNPYIASTTNGNDTTDPITGEPVQPVDALDNTFANTDLIFDGDHTHDLDGHTLRIRNGNAIIEGDLVLEGYNRGIIFRQQGVDYRLRTDRTPNGTQMVLEEVG